MTSKCSTISSGLVIISVHKWICASCGDGPKFHYAVFEHVRPFFIPVFTRKVYKHLSSASRPAAWRSVVLRDMKENWKRAHALRWPNARNYCKMSNVSQSIFMHTQHLVSFWFLQEMKRNRWLWSNGFILTHLSGVMVSIFASVFIVEWRT